MAERDLEEEIELMLKLVPGGWRLRFEPGEDPVEGVTLSICEVVDSFSNVAVAGFGGSKKAAVRDLFDKWKTGWTLRPFPMPAGSVEELKLKLAIRGREA